MAVAIRIYTDSARVSTAEAEGAPSTWGGDETREDASAAMAGTPSPTAGKEPRGDHTMAETAQCVCPAGDGSSWSSCPALGPCSVRIQSAKSPQDVHKR